MKHYIMVCIILLTLLPQNISAQSNTQIYQFYDKSTLLEWRSKYQRSMKEILDLRIWPSLTQEEKHKLSVIKFSLPLALDAQTDPFSHSSELLSSNGRVTSATVIMPVLSLKWLEDLFVAQAWLVANNCDLETSIDYISLLKYRKPQQFPGGRLPAPLAALQIPLHALDDKAVNEMP